MKKTPISILRREILVCTDPAKEAALRAKLEALLAENARVAAQVFVYWAGVRLNDLATANRAQRERKVYFA